jgi:hypothetical protein
MGRSSSPRLNTGSWPAARVRAVFVRPGYARQGIGRLLLERCEAEAKAYGFRWAELAATLPGRRLYRMCGFVDQERIAHDLGGGLTIEFVRMTKSLKLQVGRIAADTPIDTHASPGRHDRPGRHAVARRHAP